MGVKYRDANNKLRRACLLYRPAVTNGIEGQWKKTVQRLILFITVHYCMWFFKCDNGELRSPFKMVEINICASTKTELVYQEHKNFQVLHKYHAV